MNDVVVNKTHGSNLFGVKYGKFKLYSFAWEDANRRDFIKENKNKYSICLFFFFTK